LSDVQAGLHALRTE